MNDLKYTIILRMLWGNELPAGFAEHRPQNIVKGEMVRHSKHESCI